VAENPVVSKRHICGQLSPHDVTPLLSHIFGGLAPTYLSINFVRGTRLGELAQRRYTMADILPPRYCIRNIPSLSTLMFCRRRQQPKFYWTMSDRQVCRRLMITAREFLGSQ